MLSVDTKGRSSNIPEPALVWGRQEKENRPGVGNVIEYRRRWAVSFLLTIKINILN